METKPIRLFLEGQSGVLDKIAMGDQKRIENELIVKEEGYNVIFMRLTK